MTTINPGLAAYNERRKAEAEARKQGPLAVAAQTILSRAEERRKLLMEGRKP